MEDIRQKDGQIDLDFLLAKLNKLSSALYLVTSFLKDQEPLKWKLRELAGNIVLNTETVLATPASYRSITVNQLGPIIKHTLSLIELCLLDGSVSEMNFSILQKEFTAIQHALETNHHYFNFNNLLPAKSLATISREQSSWPTKPRLASLITKQKTVSQREKSQPALPAGRFKPKKANNRRPLIVDYIRSHGWSAIKDVAAAVPNCGLKTIQRELGALVNAGTLKKKGERRWSRYQLA